MESNYSSSHSSMEDEEHSKMDRFLRKAGCGLFQVILTFFVYTARICPAWSMMFMAYGNYNPGWTCMLSGFSNETSLEKHNATGVLSKGNYSESEYNTSFFDPDVTNSSARQNQTIEGSCAIYSSCEKVIFNPEASTIVTEWGLICDRSWIPSVIISIQMTGIAVGSYTGGFIGDRFGRKFCLYLSLAGHFVINIVTPLLSTSWQLLAVVRFFVGITDGTGMNMATYYPLEFATSKWRVVLTGFPSWDIAVLLFGAVIYLCKDWRWVIYTTAGLDALALLSVFWVPESMRWQAVHGKAKQAKETAKRMCKYNMRPPPEDHDIDFSSIEGTSSDKKPSILHLFRPALLKVTLSTCFLLFSASVIYFAIAFGVKALSGNFYLNFILFPLVTLPAAAFIPLVGNKLGRRFGTAITIGAQAAFSFAVVVVFFAVDDDTKGTVITVLVLGIHAVLDMFFGIIFTFIAELFPTSVRSLGSGFAYVGARVGGIVAPYLIPRSFETLHVTYIVSGGLGIVCCIVLLLLPETKGKQMKDLMGQQAAGEALRGGSRCLKRNNDGNEDDEMEESAEGEMQTKSFVNNCA